MSWTWRNSFFACYVVFNMIAHRQSTIIHLPITAWYNFLLELSCPCMIHLNSRLFFSREIINLHHQELHKKLAIYDAKMIFMFTNHRNKFVHLVNWDLQSYSIQNGTQFHFSHGGVLDCWVTSFLWILSVEPSHVVSVNSINGSTLRHRLLIMQSKLQTFTLPPTITSST